MTPGHVHALSVQASDLTAACMQDYVTVAFDGVDRHQVFERVQAMLAAMPGISRPP